MLTWCCVDVTWEKSWSEMTGLYRMHVKIWFVCVGEESSSQQEQEERLPDLPLLSEQLLLDELWDMLGECLKELEESHDQHAVLGIFIHFWMILEIRESFCANNSLCSVVVLQPAVEAFFLVHATERESKPQVRDTRESQLSHIKDEPPPLSPAPLTPATPSSLDPFFSREPSSMHISSNLPPDTQKFLRFAGESIQHMMEHMMNTDEGCPQYELPLVFVLNRDPPHSAESDPATVHHSSGRWAIRCFGWLHPHLGLWCQAQVRYCLLLAKVKREKYYNDVIHSSLCISIVLRIPSTVCRKWAFLKFQYRPVPESVLLTPLLYNKTFYFSQIL